MKTADDPMYRRFSFENCPRCSARSKRSGEPCKAPAVRGWTVCRFHGARGGGPQGAANGMFRNGRHTKEALASRVALSQLLRASRNLLSRIES